MNNNKDQDQNFNFSSRNPQVQEAQGRRNLKKFAIASFGLIIGALVVSGIVINRYDYIDNDPPRIEEN
ncbi:hypothetical protein [Thalassoporum mexicanum]|uniref:hypothetical protein n=1 Tax=Thalassoporum mexicanum TaxID=3457544 RepID=UPI0002EC0549|nr:hypothetical protein [Pseudanabaena sp. PCC 7367]